MFVFACSCVCMFVCLHVHVFACLCVCMFVCLHVRVFACSCVCMFVCLHVRVFACSCVCMFVCLHVRVFACSQWTAKLLNEISMMTKQHRSSNIYFIFPPSFLLPLPLYLCHTSLGTLGMVVGGRDRDINIFLSRMDFFTRIEFNKLFTLWKPKSML